MSDKPFVGDVGTDIIVNCGVNITGATGTKILYYKPSGVSGEWTADVYQSNYLKYTTVAGDFDEAGTYRIQAKLTLTGWTGRGETDMFKVYNVFQQG